MSHSDYRTLIARGRKAGLNTGELYAALASRPSEAADQQPGQSDGNGYVAVTREGHTEYRPLGSPQSD